MIVHVMPTYECSQKCPYCYLGNKRGDKRVIHAYDLSKKLYELIASGRTIEKINIYGGEVSNIELENFISILDKCFFFCKKINIVTNFQNPEWIKSLLELRPQVNISTSINEERPENKKVMKLLEQNKYKQLSVHQVITPKIMNENIDTLLDDLEKICTEVSFLRYSPAKENCLDSWRNPNKMFSDFIKRLVETCDKKPRKLNIVNLQELHDCLIECEPHTRDFSRE